MFTTRLHIPMRLFLLLASLVISACVTADEGGGSSSSDAKEARQQIQAPSWQTSDCLRDSAEFYFNGLYRFTEEGKINFGHQTYQDSACTTLANDSRMPDSFRADYEVKEEETLFDGTRGFGLELFIQGATVNGYLSLKEDKTLCFRQRQLFGHHHFHHVSGSSRLQLQAKRLLSKLRCKAYGGKCCPVGR